MQIQKTLTITANDTNFEVASMSDPIKQMIAYMDDWRQEEADLSSKLLMTRAAIRDVQNTILNTINQEIEDSKAAVETSVEDTTAVNAEEAALAP